MSKTVTRASRAVIGFCAPVNLGKLDFLQAKYYPSPKSICQDTHIFKETCASIHLRVIPQRKLK